MNFWDDHMGTDEGAANYMMTYGEGPGSDTRKELSSILKKGEAVLDVGCGPGWNYDHFKEYGPEVIYKGVDYSERFIRVAKERQPNANFEVQDCRDLKEDTGSYDVVILQDVLEHTNGYEKPIKEAMRVARSRIVVIFWRPFDPNMDEDVINDDGGDGYGATYSQSKWDKFIDNYEYTHFSLGKEANRAHDFYVIWKNT